MSGQCPGSSAPAAVPRQQCPGRIRTCDIRFRRDEAWLAVWHRYVDQLSIMGMAYQADRDGIIAMVDSAVLYDRLSRVVLKAPAVVRDRVGMPTTPSVVKDMRAAATDLLRWLTAFGLTPSSRTQVRTRQVSPTSRPPASDLLSVGDQQAYGRHH